MQCTRLAPSPTGALHLGNARTFLINWLIARQRGWRILLRIEDLDGPRVKRGADQQAIDDLRWFGIDWDLGPVHQSNRTSDYAAAVADLLGRKLAYPCICSRREAMLALVNGLLERAPPQSIFVVECDRRFDLSQLPDAQQWNVREYPPAVVAIYRK